MDEPSWSWPFWKFGLTKDDLTTTLHDQYNTFPSTIQDPEAFHHDVFDVAITASTTDEFHSLLASRKQQRLRELNDSLECAAFEIIAHPKLVGTDQWQYALQLFRTRSLDSLVRYFSSYLPEHPPVRQPGSRSPLSSASSFADCSSVATASTVPSSVDTDENRQHDDHDDAYAHVPTFLTQSCTDKSVFTHEPEDIVSHIDTHLPPAPRSSSAMEESSSSPIDSHSCRSKIRRSSTSSTTHSFTTSTTHLSHSNACLRRISESIESPPEEVQTPGSSEADLSDSRSSVDSYAFSGSESGRRNSRDFSDGDEDEEEDLAITQFPTDMFHDADGLSATLATDAYDFLNSETPTPKPDGSFTFIASPSRKTDSPLYRVRSSPRERTTPPKAATRRRADSPPRFSRRTPEESGSRIQKSLADLSRPTRSKGRARLV